MGEHRSVDILIVTALAEELEVILDYLPEERVLHSDSCDLTYYIGSIQRSDSKTVHYAVTCLGQMGNPDAAVGATNAIRDLRPANMCMFGLAAGIRRRVNIGDVIVATNVFYYEQAKVRPGTVETRPHWYATDRLLQNKMSYFASVYSSDFEVKFGPIAVGEKVVAQSAAVKELMKAAPKLVGIEMESYGVAVAAETAVYRPRFIAIRGVCDHANAKKNDKFRSLALENAAGFLSSFLKDDSLRIEELANAPSRNTETLIAIQHLSLNQRSSLEQGTHELMVDFQHFEVKELFIDQTDLYRNGCLTQPASALQRQVDVVDRLNDLVALYPRAETGYFGLAHIPLVFYIGYEINRRFVQVFSTDRSTGKWMSLRSNGNGPELKLLEAPVQAGHDERDVILKVSISYAVRPEYVHEILSDQLPIYHLSVSEPRPDIVTSVVQLERYTRLFQTLLTEIGRQFPSVERIHLFWQHHLL